jgi:hypothetical protein
VPIPVDEELASRLRDPALRAVAGVLLQRMLRPEASRGLDASIAALRAEAWRRGLTDEIVVKERAAYNAERRDPPTAR